MEWESCNASLRHASLADEAPAQQQFHRILLIKFDLLIDGPFTTLGGQQGRKQVFMMEGPPPLDALEAAPKRKKNVMIDLISGTAAGVGQLCVGHPFVSPG
jgi:hypothetical protein